MTDTLLDDLTGFEFEDTMEDVFRHLGYQNVRQSRKTADEGRDILMEESVGTTTGAVVVECKHTEQVGRPVVQKLHSAVATYAFDGPKRGLVVTTGRFTEPATEYATALSKTGEYPIELIDGHRLRDIADSVGLDLLNGRIEVLCNETLRPFDPTGSPAEPMRRAFASVAHLDPQTVGDPTLGVTFQPTLSVETHLQCTFETSVGVIHHLDERDEVLIDASRDGLTLADTETAQLVADNARVTMRTDDEQLTTVFDEIEKARFGRSETDYLEWVQREQCARHTTTVEYTGDNNVTYEKTCEPSPRDVDIEHVRPLYVPRVRATAELGDHTYTYAYDAAGPNVAAVDDGVRTCVHCAADAETYTYCQNCGSINCPEHVRTERVEGTPVCTGCAVTGQFALTTKYFYSRENRDAFEQEYDAMSLLGKAQENVHLAAGLVLAVLFVLVLLASAVGGVL